ncbi:glycoside hydrolase family protein [Parabacteroides johnsonii]|uniref:glycoside hydrolase family protein n=1 Tax=Parabacteroides johnsonii TaxID=387661 RepID=UPI003AB6E329
MRYNILLFLFLLPFVGNASAQTKDKEKAESIRDLPLFERAVSCTRHFEGWHSEKHHPYVGWGHRLQKGEAYSARIMTRRQADAILREDLRKFCAMFRRFGADCLLLDTLAFNVGPAKLLGGRRYPKSKLIQKLEAGNRDIYREYVSSCHYKGKRHVMLLKRRKAEFALLYIP